MRARIVDHLNTECKHGASRVSSRPVTTSDLGVYKGRPQRTDLPGTFSGLNRLLNCGANAASIAPVPSFSSYKL